MRFLIIEDEALIADVIVDVLHGAGHHVPFVLGSLERAAELTASDGFDVAILDANLRGQSTVSVARQLRLRQIPFLVISGYDRAELPSELAGAPFIRKPFQPAELLAAVIQLETLK